MKFVIVSSLSLLLLFSVSSYAQNRTRMDPVTGRIIIEPYRPNQYGPGIHADGTGQPFEWETEHGQRVVEPVVPDGYGPGVGRDIYGRPVRKVPKY